MILFGHPTGNPNAFHAALAHFEMARLEAICIPWMPSRTSLAGLRSIAPLRFDGAAPRPPAFRAASQRPEGAGTLRRDPQAHHTGNRPRRRIVVLSRQ
jgi:hypothetical protein